MQKTITRRREGDIMVVVTEVRHSAIIDFKKIVEAADIEGDDEMNAPWEEHDGDEHEAVRIQDAYDESYLQANPENVVGHRHDRVLIRIDPSVVEEVRQYHLARGASKQVAAEEAAFALRRRYEQLREWYNDGWHWHMVSIEFMGHYEHLGGILCDPGDEYLSEVEEDLALEVASALEKEGYTVINKPSEMHPSNRERIQSRVAQNLGFRSRQEYEAWLRGAGGNRP